METARQLFIAYFRTNNSIALKHSAGLQYSLEMHWKSFRFRFNDFKILRSSGKSLFTFAQCCNLCQEVVCWREITNIHILLELERNMLCALNTKFIWILMNAEFWVFCFQFYTVVCWRKLCPDTLHGNHLQLWLFE